MKYTILTNNPLAYERFGSDHSVMFMDVKYGEILRTAREMIDDGAVLLNHPLYGSVKPGETPYRSLMLSIPPCRTDGT